MMAEKTEGSIVEETGKLAPDDPSLEMANAPRLNKKGIKILFVGLGSIVMVGLVFSLSQDGARAAASQDDAESTGRFSVRLPNFLRSDQELPPSRREEQEAQDRGEIADLTSEETTTVYRNEPVVFSRRSEEPGSLVDETERSDERSQSTTVTTEQPRTTTQASTITPRNTTLAPAARPVVEEPNPEEIMREQARTAGMFHSVQVGGSPGSSAISGVVGDPTSAAIQEQLRLQNQTDYEQQNQQQQKQDWLASRQADFSGYVRATPTYPVSPGQELKGGTVIPITMITGINSDLPGNIVAQVIQDVYDSITGQRILIPRGSRAIGTYSSSVAFGQDRVLVAWDRIIRPDGVSIALQGMQGVDRSGSSGMADQVDFHIDDIAASVAVSSTFTLGSGALIAWLSSNDSLTAIGELLGNDTNDAAGKIVEEYAGRVLDRQPTIVVRPGIRGSIFVSRDIVLPSFEDWRGGF